MYLKRCVMINQIPDITLISYDRATEFVASLVSWTEKASDTDDIVKNKSISFDPMKFKTFVDEFKTLLTSVKGCRGISLEYVIREGHENNGPPLEVPYPNVNDNEVIATFATLEGPEYNIDNGNVYTMLRIILTSTPGWNVISKFSRMKNGRMAYKALKQHYQGRSYYELMKTQATSLMSKTFFNGDRAKFTWEKFVEVHMNAHLLFEEANEPLSESMKILNLKQGIRDGAMMENTIEAARTSSETNRTFENYVNFLTEGVASKRSRKETFKNNTPQSVSGLDTDDGGRSYHGGRGRGQGRGRG